MNQHVEYTTQQHYPNLHQTNQPTTQVASQTPGETFPPKKHELVSCLGHLVWRSYPSSGSIYHHL